MVRPRSHSFPGAAILTLSRAVIVDLHLGALTAGSVNVRHLHLAGSDLGLEVELLKDGHADLRASLSVMDVNIEDQSKTTAPVTILGRTMPRDLVRPLVSIGTRAVL